MWQAVACKLFESKHLKKIQAQPNSENKVLLQVMMMAKMNQKMITGYQRIQKGYDEVELGL